MSIFVKFKTFYVNFITFTQFTYFNHIGFTFFFGLCFSFKNRLVSLFPHLSSYFNFLPARDPITQKSIKVSFSFLSFLGE